MTHARAPRACFAGSLLICAAANAQPSYTVTPLGSVFGYGTAPNAINNSGQVVGHSYPYAFLYSDGVMSNLGTLEPGDEESYANDINSLGQVVGSSAIDDDFGFRAVLWDERGVHDLGGLGGGESAAEGINAAGEIVGVSRLASGFSHAFLWQNGAMSDLGALGGDESRAYAINNAGQIVGQADTEAGQPVPFLWQDGAMTNLGALPGSTGGGWAFDINEAEQVIGSSFLPGLIERAFVWQGGEMTDLGTLGGPFVNSQARSLNESGQIVGYSWGGGQGRALTWIDGVMYDLNDLVPPQYQGLTIATGVNDLGQIVSIGNIDSNQAAEAYLLTPVPEPSCLAILGLGMLAMTARRAKPSRVQDRARMKHTSVR